MLHPDTRLAWVGDHLGMGVVATADLPAGTVVWAQDDLDAVFSPADYARLDPLLRATADRYVFEEDDGRLILCWDHGRYVNHSCEANLLGAGLPFELAVRDIAAGEQLTDDYDTFRVRFSLTCACGAPSCRGTLGDPTERLVAAWRARWESAFQRVRSVPQPLWPLVARHPLFAG